MKLSQALTLAAILLLSLIIYTYKLHAIPNGLYVDEAVSAYNAYSILKTGKDEYGKAFPLAFRFFASYTPPLFVYTQTLPIKFLGLNIFSARILSAISATASVFFVYLLLEILKITNKKSTQLLLTLLYAISPWVVFFGRIGYEVFFGYFIFLTAIYFSAKSIKKPVFLVPFSLLLTLTIYTSHTQKYLFIIFLPLFFVLFKNIFKTSKKHVLTSALLISLLLIPQSLIINTKATLAKGSLFFTDQIRQRAAKSPLPQILSLPVSAVYEFQARYIAYFSPKNLFFTADPTLQRSIPELSVFYSWMVLPYSIGLFAFFKKPFNENKKLILLLLFTSPIPASLTKDPFSTQRALPFLLPIFLIISIGLVKILNSKSRLLRAFTLLAILIYSPIILWRGYFVLLPTERAQAWNFGFQKLSHTIHKNPNTQFVFDQTRQKPFYIEYAFFTALNPKQLQESHSENLNNYYNQPNFQNPKKIKNLIIKPINWKQDPCIEQILVGDSLSFSETNIKEHFLTKSFEIKDPRGETIFLGYKTNPALKCK